MRDIAIISFDQTPARRSVPSRKKRIPASSSTTNDRIVSATLSLLPTCAIIGSVISVQVAQWAARS